MAATLCADMQVTDPAPCEEYRALVPATSSLIAVEGV